MTHQANEAEADETMTEGNDMLPNEGCPITRNNP